ncbi:MAG: hypothetical protein DRN30_05485 [Thermoplasmata archaeon]|nr:MAG: hypothetical protein DRN30_05485 [Thermoplasmata archaeon]
MIDNKGRKSPFKFFYFITVRDNEGYPRGYVYNVFRSVVKKYRAKYYGKLSEKPYPHVHTIIATDEYINYKDVWKSLIPKGVSFRAYQITKEDDFKRIKRYIDTHDGFLLTHAILTSFPNSRRILTVYGHPTTCRIEKTLRRCAV